MSLRGQDDSRDLRAGYAMAALLVAMAVMAVLMSAALPVWRHEAQREKEEELVFRGQQYVRALRLYQARTQSMPGSVDLLVNGRFLRKKYKDPITGDDFDLIGAAGAAGQTGQATQTGGGRAAQPQMSASAFGPGTMPGGIMGVRSKSKDESIRLYQGRNHYNEWNFLFVNQVPTGPGRGGNPGRGGRAGNGAPTNPFGGPGGIGVPGGGIGVPSTFGFPGRGATPAGRGAGPGRGPALPPGGVSAPGRGRSNQ